MGLVKIGSLAPQFNLLNQDGELVNLKDFRGVSTPAVSSSYESTVSTRLRSCSSIADKTCEVIV